MSDIPSIRRTGIIFRSGVYGAKGSYSDADIDAMAGDNPLPVNLEHRPSLLDNKLGQCVRRFSAFDDNGKKVLMGEWDEPAPLAALLGDTVRRASIEIDMATKQPTGLALTHIPHISDAALFSAVTDAYAKFSRGEQIIPLAETPSQENSMSQTIETVVVETAKPSFLERLRAMFSDAQPEELDAAHDVLTQAKTGKTPRELELETKLAEFEAAEKNAAFSAIEANATNEADALVTAGVIKAKGNEDYEQAVAAFSAAALADINVDARAKIACFAADAPTAKFSMAAHLKAVYAKLPKYDGAERTNDLTPTQLAVFEQAKTTVTGEDGGAVDLAERNRMRKESGLEPIKA